MGFMMGKSSKSTSTSVQTTDASQTSEDRKVAQNGVGNQTFGEKSTVAINGFSGKDIGDLLHGLTHDSPFGQPTATQAAAAAAGVGSPSDVAAGGSSMLKPMLLIGAGVAVVGLVLFMVARR